jgi:high-affinity iron transporter
MPEILALLERGGLLIYRLLLLSVLILVVMFVGKGIAALQEAGTLPLDPPNSPGIPALGLYPNVQELVLRALRMFIICGVFAYNRYTSKGAR